MKKSILAAMAAFFLFAMPVAAHPPIQVYVDGQTVSFDQAPVIIDDRTLVPMRAIFKALGSQVTWSEPNQTITSTKGGDTVVLKIGDTGLYKNGQLVYTMAVPAQIINERTLVPIRAIAEAFDADVAWDPIGYVITILSSGSEVEGGYHTDVKADDGTTVLSFKMDLQDSNGSNGTKIKDSLEMEVKSLAKDFINDFENQAKKEYESAKVQGLPFTPYYFVGSYELTRDDSKYVSYYGTSTQYTGGSETIRGCTSHTYSASTGKELTIFDIIDDSEKELHNFFVSSFTALMEERPKSFYSNGKDRLEVYLDEVGFYVIGDGLGFYLPPETIAPNETGIVSFTVKYVV
ncbi:stalk domain-containing protein [Anaerotignum sp.]|uniref:stalk domain-containing protein n=1 Tax=Anaerotignum sp. TaxID=2039241 RepID=UPI0033318596